ncbi:MAG: hypothetical protein K2X09_07285 [Rickettsiales bacterium]|nr:hypothetical protein [Rickettsiales bacterium]
MSEQSKPTMSIRPALSRQRIASQRVHEDAMVHWVEVAIANANHEIHGGEKTKQLDGWRREFNIKLHSVVDAVFNADEQSSADSPARKAYLDAVQAAWQRVGDHVDILREAYPHIAEKLPIKRDFIAHGPAVAQGALFAMAAPVDAASLNPRDAIEAELKETMGAESFISLMEEHERWRAVAAREPEPMRQRPAPFFATSAVVTTTPTTPDNAARNAIINVPGKNGTTWYAAFISATHSAVNVLNQAQEGKASEGIMSDLVQFETALNAYAKKLERYRGNNQLSDASFNTLKSAYNKLSFKLRSEYGENLLTVDDLDKLRPAMREAAIAVLPADPKASQPLKNQGTLRGPGAGDNLSGREEGRS